jgi:hypothetical protein
MTTTSTSNFVEIEGDDASLYASWSTMETPDQLPPGSSLSNSPSQSPRRRLRKRSRPAHLRPAAPPSEVLARNTYNYRDTDALHEASPPLPPMARPPLESHPSSSSMTLAASISQKFHNRLEKLRNGDLDENWVCVDVEQRITQHVVKRDKD